MRKIISIFLILTLALGLLCSCGGNENNVSSDVSQIEAVVNVSSEETSSQAEAVSSAESIVSSEIEVSSEVVSSEISVPEYPDRTKVPYAVGIQIFKTGALRDFEEGAIITEYSQIENVDLGNVTSAQNFREKYNKEFFNENALILKSYVHEDSGFKTTISNLTKKDGVLYADYNYQITDGYNMYAVFYNVYTLEVKKSDIADITQINVTSNWDN